jgi:hypothetical protein
MKTAAIAAILALLSIMGTIQVARATDTFPVTIMVGEKEGNPTFTSSGTPTACTGSLHEGNDGLYGTVCTFSLDCGLICGVATNTVTVDSPSGSLDFTISDPSVGDSYVSSSSFYGCVQVVDAEINIFCYLSSDSQNNSTGDKYQMYILYPNAF